MNTWKFLHWIHQVCYSVVCGLEWQLLVPVTITKTQFVPILWQASYKAHTEQRKTGAINTMSTSEKTYTNNLGTVISTDGTTSKNPIKAMEQGSTHGANAFQSFKFAVLKISIKISNLMHTLDENMY